MKNEEVFRIIGQLEGHAKDTTAHLKDISEAFDKVRDGIACLPGLKKMVEDHEKRLRVAETAKNRQLGAATAVGGISGLVAAFAAFVALFKQ